ncbi:ATP-grasp domain-containing protein [Nonomuraea sp. K274]|uniref:ATP-grasp domain-containing protein n=1 Tax=Nonomuraea cypriaca TaxID=1187855 RepID=A0A931A1J2_9ACTN|nr:ATP-grasp domain-containing protein [Nonomuraea cypriaca]MBF8184496.1 ATP-grasp domain-containing protein [Nonomuraea cypriaca]
MPADRTGRVVLLGASRTLTERACALGLETLLVTTKQAVPTVDLELVDRLVVVDSYDDKLLMPLVSRAHEETPFGACITFVESALDTAAQINEQLGLGWVSPETVALTRDKSLMRERLNTLGLCPVPARLCSSAAEALAFAEETGFPLIVKPPMGVASIDVRMARDADELAGMFADGRPLHVEEYIDGPEFSVETFSYSGRHVFLAIVEKRLLDGTFVEIGHTVPARLDDDAAASIRKVVSLCLDALGLTEGPAHTEVKLTPDGAKIIETHNRVGGDFIWELVRLATDWDLCTMTLEWAAGTAPAPSWDVAESTATSAIRFLAPPPGRVKRIFGPELLAGMPGVVKLGLFVGVGDEIPTVSQSFDRVGYVIATASDAAAVNSVCDRASELVRFVV